MEVHGHSVYCAVLSVAANAVAHGLAETVRGLLCVREGVAALVLAKAVIRALSHRRDTLMDAVRRVYCMLYSTDASTELILSSKQMTTEFGDNPCSMDSGCRLETQPHMSDKCCIDGGVGSRSVRARAELRQGETVLREQPQYLVPSYTCACPATCNMLAEHVEMAWAIHCREWSAGAEQVRATSDVLISGCRGTYSPDPAFTSNQWPLHTILIMITASFLCVSTFTTSADPMEHRCLSLLDVLSMLPQNAHAVDDISISVSKDPSGVCDTLTQRRVAIAIFFQASAMNHSCNPNCSLKYTKVKSNYDNAETCRYELELVAIRDINTGEELTVSYGVVSGRYSFRRRRETLAAQYLFLCRCVTCLQAELEDKMIDRSTLNLSHHIMLSKMIVDAKAAMKTHFINEESKSTDVEKKLHRLKSYYEEVAETKSIDSEYWNCEIVQLECKYLDSCAKVLATSGSYSAAAVAVRKAVDLMLNHGIYTARDVAIGREFVKLSELCNAAGEELDAQRNALRAFYCLNGFVCDDDPDLLSLLNIFTFRKSCIK